MNMKKGGRKSFRSPFQSFKLLLFSWRDCTHRASVCAGTAVNTCRRVDRINVTLVDCTLRAFAHASSACNAI